MSPIIFNNERITTLNFNNTNVTECWFNGVKVFGGSSTPNYFYVECLNDDRTTYDDPTMDPAYCSLDQYDENYYPVIYYSTDKTNWSLMTNSTMLTFSVGDKYYFKAGPSGNVGINQDGASTYNRLGFGYGDFAIGGDITTLQNENGNVDTYTVGTTFQFARMCYQESRLTSIANLVLPTKVFNTCFHYAFYQSGITDFPDFSHITHLGYNGFGSCFRETSAAGAINFSSLANYTGADADAQGRHYGFNHAFRQSGVTSAIFGSTSPVKQAFNSAFLNCSSLISITVGWSDWGGELGTATMGTYNNWVSGVSDTGTFYCPSTLYPYQGTVGVPNGWTVINTD